MDEAAEAGEKADGSRNEADDLKAEAVEEVEAGDQLLGTRRKPSRAYEIQN